MKNFNSAALSTQELTSVTGGRHHGFNMGFGFGRMMNPFGKVPADASEAVKTATTAFKDASKTLLNKRIDGTTATKEDYTNLFNAQIKLMTARFDSFIAKKFPTTTTTTTTAKQGA